MIILRNTTYRICIVLAIAAMALGPFGIGMAWGYWIGRNDAKVEHDLVRINALATCDGPAWIDARDSKRVLCASGSMRDLRPQPKR